MNDFEKHKLIRRLQGVPQFFLDIIPQELTMKLLEYGMPLYLRPTLKTPSVLYKGENYRIPTYARVFDFLVGEGLYIYIAGQRWAIPHITGYKLHIKLNKCHKFHDAANAAIEKALELLKEGKVL